MSRKQNLYTGRSGPLAVVAEFLRRGYNAAIPEIDVGEDICVIRDAEGELSRIQVKSAIARGKNANSGTYNVPLAQLRRIHTPELYYIFALHHNHLWREFVVIPRTKLQLLLTNDSIGNVLGNNLILYLSFEPDEVQCSGVSLQPYRNNWTLWPLLSQ